MHSAKRYLLIALSFALALSVMAAFAPRIAHAVTATMVQVVNPVAIDQNNNGVQVTNVPAVQVQSLPAVQLANGGAVTLNGNSAANPVFVDVDSHGRQAVVLEASMGYQPGLGGNAGGSNLFPPGSNVPFSVPAGQRLVIENISGTFNVPDGQAPSDIFVVSGVLTGGGGHQIVDYSFVPTYVSTQQTGNGAIASYALNQHVLIYQDTGQPLIFIEADRNSSAGFANAQFTLTGYLVDCTIAPCRHQ